MDFALPPSAAALRRDVRRLVDEELRPREHELPREGPPPPELEAWVHERRRAWGLWGLTVPAAEGGRGLGWLERAVVQEELHRTLLGLWPLQLFTAGEPPAPLYAGNAEQRRRWLRPCLEGTRRASLLRVPAQGDPSRGPGLRVRPVRGGLLLDGEWRAVPAWVARDLLLVVTEADGRWWGCLCEPGLDGFRVARPRGTMGATTLVDLVWERCWVAEDRCFPGAGPAAAAWEAAERCTVAAAGAVGAAEYCLERAIAYARSRRTFGQPLADRQAIQWMLADSARELHAARLLVYRAAALADAGDDPGPWPAAAKAFATEAACRVVDRVIQIHGGYGYCADLPFERFWRELRWYRLAGGPNQTLAADLAVPLLDDLCGWPPDPGEGAVRP
jgi:acyl-CoA dehydrogenase